ncbi:unnamed protein product, partial [marine sediment metagenome]
RKDLTVTDHRIMLSQNNGVLGATTYTGTLTGVAGTFTGTQTYGVDATGVDCQWYGDTTVNSMLWDYTDDRLEMTHADILFDDNSDIIIGSHYDFVIDSASTGVLLVTSLLTDETASVNLGANTLGMDLKLFGTTTGEYMLWDADADSLLGNCGNILFTMTDGEANQFKVDATGTHGGNVIVLETSEGGISLLADGDTEGDIGIDAEDDITVTAAGNLTFAVTGTFDAGGSQILNQLRQVEDVADNNESPAATESGSVIVVTFTGTSTITLPQAAAGLFFTIVDNSATAGDDVVVDCQAGDNIDADTNGDAIESVTDAVPQTVTLFAVSATRWVTINKVGTWGAQ